MPNTIIAEAYEKILNKNLDKLGTDAFTFKGIKRARNGRLIYLNIGDRFVSFMIFDRLVKRFFKRSCLYLEYPQKDIVNFPDENNDQLTLRVNYLWLFNQREGFSDSSNTVARFVNDQQNNLP
jgi:hypothetical protein